MKTKHWLFLVIAVCLVAIIGVVFGVAHATGYFAFKDMQNSCYQKIKSENQIATIYFEADSNPITLQSIVADVLSSQGAISATSTAGGSFHGNPTSASLTVALSPTQDQDGVLNYIKQEAQRYNLSITYTKSKSVADRATELKNISSLNFFSSNWMGYLNDCISPTSTDF